MSISPGHVQSSTLRFGQTVTLSTHLQRQILKCEVIVSTGKCEYNTSIPTFETVNYLFLKIYFVSAGLRFQKRSNNHCLETLISSPRCLHIIHIFKMEISDFLEPKQNKNVEKTKLLMSVLHSNHRKTNCNKNNTYACTLYVYKMFLFYGVYTIN